MQLLLSDQILASLSHQWKNGDRLKSICLKSWLTVGIFDIFIFSMVLFIFRFASSNEDPSNDKNVLKKILLNTV